MTTNTPIDDPALNQEADAHATDAPPVPVETIEAALPSDPPPLRLENITKTYGDVMALADVSFTAAPSEFHCLAGPNGSGKTTLGRIAVGLTHPTTGTVTGPTNDIGYGFQAPRYYPSLTVRENLTTFCRASGVDPDSQWVAEITEALRLHRVAHQPASELSGGFQKKLDLAVAVATTPTYVWLDEPLGDLDDVSVSRVVALLDAYVAGGGGVIVSTHNFDAFDDVFTHLTVFLDGVQNPTMELGETDGEEEVRSRYRDAVDELYTAHQ